ncbi:MAG: hypothetical protein KC636_24055 [Myxococcales bacterium]|nr:hypothetical protein [Myxococcales bacterium]
MRRLAIAALAASALACVFPAGSSTGLEFTWRFHERAPASGSARTCAGALVSQVEIAVVDVEDPQRADTRTFPCDAGHDPEREQFAGLSAAFFDVRPGTYAVTVRARGGGSKGDLEVLREEPLEIIVESGVILTPVELSPPPAAWTLTVTNTDACDQLAATLRLADPATALVEPDAATPYGAGLPTGVGLGLDGAPVDCAALVDGDLEFPTVDLGEYALELDVDGRTCALPVVIDGHHAPLELDLSDPCQGRA